MPKLQIRGTDGSAEELECSNEVWKTLSSGKDSLEYSSCQVHRFEITSFSHICLSHPSGCVVRAFPPESDVHGTDLLKF